MQTALLIIGNIHGVTDGLELSQEQVRIATKIETGHLYHLHLIVDCTLICLHYISICIYHHDCCTEHMYIFWFNQLYDGEAILSLKRIN